MREKRFGPLFVTQFLNAFNDNLFKAAMVILVIYTIYNDPAKEAGFSGLAGGLFILPFFLFSALLLLASSYFPPSLNCQKYGKHQYHDPLIYG